ncbi:hypothetical protein J6590_022595 [Homalodisca vitripennis]|nr:hypothetical protein J6590_022595 [Homalodisca vitripennis]
MDLISSEDVVFPSLVRMVDSTIRNVGAGCRGQARVRGESDSHMSVSQTPDGTHVQETTGRIHHVVVWAGLGTALYSPPGRLLQRPWYRCRDNYMSSCQHGSDHLTLQEHSWTPKEIVDL